MEDFPVFTVLATVVVIGFVWLSEDLTLFKVAVVLLLQMIVAANE